jgi:hypothetical protein
MTWAWPTGQARNVTKEPLDWTDAHHIVSWSDGGPTNVDNLVLLCRHHHRLIHHPTAGWQIRPAPDGHPEFIPPPAIDPERRPRRNLYHAYRWAQASCNRHDDGALSLASVTLEVWHSPDESLVIRTDFVHEAEWLRIRSAVVEPQTEDEFEAYVQFVDDRAL